MQGIRLHIEPAEHVAKDGAALAVAGRIEVPVVPHLVDWRSAHPELCHAKRLESFAIGGLEQSRGTALAGSCRWNGWGKELRQRLLFAQSIEELELTE